MGCVLSSNKKTPPNLNIYNSHTKVQSTTTRRSPPLTIPFLEQEEEVKEVLSETPVINSPIIHSNDESNISKKSFSSKEKKQCHNNIHDSVFKIAKIFNPKDEHHEPYEMYRKFSRSMRVGSDPKETAREQSKIVQVGSDQKEMFKELSRSIRVGSDPRETVKDVGGELRRKSPVKYRNVSPARKSDQLSGSGQTRSTSPARRPDHPCGSGQTRNTSPARRPDHPCGSSQTRNTSPARRLDHLPGSGQTRNISPARRIDHPSGSGQTRNTSPAKRTDHPSGSGQTRNTSPARKSGHLTRSGRLDNLTGSGQIRNTSPARKTDHLTESSQTRNISPSRVRSGQIRNISPSRVGSERNTSGISRNDNGESSCRRSPIMCGDQINGGTSNSISRCPSLRKSGKSPGRVRSELGDRHRSPVPEAGNGSRSNRENRENNSKRHLRRGINESIENPLVSMECFIFI